MNNTIDLRSRFRGLFDTPEPVRVSVEMSRAVRHEIQRVTSIAIVIGMLVNFLVLYYIDYGILWLVGGAFFLSFASKALEGQGRKLFPARYEEMRKMASLLKTLPKEILPTSWWILAFLSAPTIYLYTFLGNLYSLLLGKKSSMVFSHRLITKYDATEEDLDAILPHLENGKNTLPRVIWHPAALKEG